MLRVFLATCVLAAFVAGCSDDGDEGAASQPPDLVIPEKVAVDGNSMPALTEEQFNKSKEFIRYMLTQHDLDEHVLIPNEQSWEKRRKREEKYMRLNGEQRQAIQEIRQRCQIEHRPSDNFGNVNYAPGAVLTSTDPIQTTGNGCPATLMKQTDTRTTILSIDNANRSAKARVEGTFRSRSEYRETKHALAAQMTDGESTSNFRGTMEMAPQNTRYYAQFTGNGFANVLTDGLGRVELDLRGDILEVNRRRDYVVFTTVRARGETHPYAFHMVEENEVGRVDRAFIGNRELTREEIVELRIDEWAKDIAIETESSARMVQ